MGLADFTGSHEGLQGYLQLSVAVLCEAEEIEAVAHYDERPDEKESVQAIHQVGWLVGWLVGFVGLMA